MKKQMKPGRRYFIINIDEPYAPEIYEVLKRGQMAKGPEHWPEGDISFEEWLQQTYGDEKGRTEIENKIKDIKLLNCYMVEFECRESTLPRRLVVIAHSVYEAVKMFRKDWEAKYEVGEVDIPVDELQNISIQEWCPYWDGLLGNY